MKEEKDIQTQYQRFLDNQASADEVRALMTRFGTVDEKILHQLVQKAFGSRIDNSPLPAEGEQVIQGIHERLQEHLFQKRKHLYRRFLPYAAVLLAAIVTALYFYPRLFVNRKSELNQEIGPGGNRATLTLADGTKIDLDSAKAGIHINDENISYNDGATLIAKKGPRATGTDNAELTTYNILSTPKGGQYQIILSDGTKVWLNAASKLKYPSIFAGNKREVELEGEAYFSVAKTTDKPFTVRSRNQEVLVIGTEFNLCSYKDEKEIKTTLIKGAVQVSMVDSANTGQPVSIRLNPGEQAVLDGISMSKNNVKMDEEIAWRSGKISLANKTLKEILTELSRWYDIDVVYQGTVPEGTFFGRANRSDNISSVLRLLESAGVNYRLEGRKLIIGS